MGRDQRKQMVGGRGMVGVHIGRSAGVGVRRDESRKHQKDLYGGQSA